MINTTIWEIFTCEDIIFGRSTLPWSVFGAADDWHSYWWLKMAWATQVPPDTATALDATPWIYRKWSRREGKGREGNGRDNCSAIEENDWHQSRQMLRSVHNQQAHIGPTQGKIHRSSSGLEFHHSRKPVFKFNQLPKPLKQRQTQNGGDSLLKTGNRNDQQSQFPKAGSVTGDDVCSALLTFDSHVLLWSALISGGFRGSRPVCAVRFIVSQPVDPWCGVRTLGVSQKRVRVPCWLWRSSQ